jgi:hypothetical protein
MGYASGRTHSGLLCSITKQSDPGPFGIRDNTKAVPQILEEIKGMREDIQPGYSTHFRQVQADVKAIKERLGMS